MKLYRMLIRPQISHPDQHYKPVCRDLEQDGKWYAEEEKETIKERYKHLENTFEQVVFDVKYEPIPAIPLEWLRDKMQKPRVTVANPFGYVLAEWLEEQEVQDG